MSNKEELFIGSRKIKMILDDPNDKDSIIVEFKNGESGKLKKKLYDFIVQSEVGNGDSIKDVANAYIASKFVKELADYGYERFQIEGVAAAIGNIVHNLSEEAIGKKFGVKSSLNIKLSDIL